ncbi:hypothetical protein [Teredinibacter turnerae]|uniref:hypothetical protein n=1 Tax=Teredinibacter turnerae TaxID=2426 RepID=UPI00048C992E|nr:hypothetical protein [Teredinibacter turnerae]
MKGMALIISIFSAIGALFCAYSIASLEGLYHPILSIFEVFSRDKGISAGQTFESGHAFFTDENSILVLLLASVLGGMLALASSIYSVKKQGYYAFGGVTFAFSVVPFAIALLEFREWAFA